MTQVISSIKSYSRNKEIRCCNYAVVMQTLDPDHVMKNKPKPGVITTHEAVIKIEI